MREVELKVRVHNFKNITKKLKDKKIKLPKPIIQIDEIFFNQNYRKAKNTVLRIRKIKNKYKLTLKNKLTNELDNEEREINIKNPEETKRILAINGWGHALTIKKQRIECKYKKYKICLDKVYNLGNFIEIEKLTLNQNKRQKMQEEMIKFLLQLGIRKKNIIKKAYYTLFFDKRIKKII